MYALLGTVVKRNSYSSSQPRCLNMGTHLSRAQFSRRVSTLSKAELSLPIKPFPLFCKMAKVLRGGKWGSAPSRSNSRSEVPSVSESERDTEKHSNQKGVLISFVEQRKELGIAVYDPSVNNVFISRVPCAEDYQDASQIVSLYDQYFIILPKTHQDNDSLINAIRPNCVPQSAREESQASHHSQRPVTEYSGTLSPSESEDAISFIPNSEFCLTKARELCSLVNVIDMPKNLTRDSRLQYLSHVIGGENVVIRALGGLLSFILQQGVLGALGKNSDEICINAICPKNFSKSMRISPAVSQALYIFSHELHPLGRGSLRGKEGVSLFGILKGQVKTAAGRHLLRSWLLYPSTDLNQIQERQLCVQNLQSNSRRALLTTMRDALSGVKNVEGILGRIQKHSAEASDWKAMHSSMSSFIFIIEALKTAAQQDERLSHSSLLTRALGVNESHLREPTRWIESAVDFEESRVAGRMIVAAGFSAEIDDLKRTYSGLDDFLTNIGMSELARMAESNQGLQIKSFNFKFETQIGFLIAVPDHECEEIGIDRFEDHGMSFMFRSDHDGFHFKNQKCHELDQEIGDIHGTILELEAHACRYLGAKVLEHASAIMEMTSIVKELDCLQALAVAANEFSWTMPVFVDDDHGFEIEEGRHPLVELVVPTFVPNSTRVRLGDVHVLSGPNFSGKSIYLTQVALITVLAQIGSCVPAKSAKMVVMDSINGRISTIDSIANGSIFFQDASQVATMLRKPPVRSLNILDEFGNGTAGVDGMALLASVINELATNEEKMSMTLCATHFVEILGERFLPLSSPRIGLFSMEVQTRPLSLSGNPEPPTNRRRFTSEVRRTLPPSERSPNVAADSGERRMLGSDCTSDIIRTYRLLPGSISHESRALHCARDAGVPRFILQRAAQLRDAVSRLELVTGAAATQLNSLRIRMLFEDVRAFVRADLGGDSQNQS